MELPQLDRVMVLKEARSISNAELTDLSGEAFELSELNGKVSFVFFGFTNCPDVCPIAMAKFRQFIDSDGVDLNKVNLVLISVDGERDTPAVMKSYLEQFSSRIIGLTGQPEMVRHLGTEFRASFFHESHHGGNGDYSVSHSNQMFLLDTAGQLRAELHNPPVDSMVKITRALLE